MAPEDGIDRSGAVVTDPPGGETTESDEETVETTVAPEDGFDRSGAVITDPQGGETTDAPRRAHGAP